MLRRQWQMAAGIAWAVQLASPAMAHAFQSVKVGPNGATVFVNPQSDSATAGTLPAGATVNIGELPKNGYYRSTSRKLSGWIQEDQLILPAPAHDAKSENVTTQVPPPATPAGKSANVQPKIYAGALGGLGIAGGGSSMTFGADVGYKFMPMLGAGAYFTYIGLTPASGTGGASMMLLAAELNYYVPPVPELHFGGKIGIGFASASATATANVSTGVTTYTPAGTTTGLATGAAMGYDYPVIPELSLGGEVNVFYIAGGVSSSLVSLLGDVKYTF